MPAAAASQHCQQCRFAQISRGGTRINDSGRGFNGQEGFGASASRTARRHLVQRAASSCSASVNSQVPFERGRACERLDGFREPKRRAFVCSDPMVADQSTREVCRRVTGGEIAASRSTQVAGLGPHRGKKCHRPRMLRRRPPAQRPDCQDRRLKCWPPGAPPSKGKFDEIPRAPLALPVKTRRQAATVVLKLQRERARSGPMHLFLSWQSIYTSRRVS